MSKEKTVGGTLLKIGIGVVLAIVLIIVASVKYGLGLVNNSSKSISSHETTSPIFKFGIDWFLSSSEKPNTFK